MTISTLKSGAMKGAHNVCSCFKVSHPPSTLEATAGPTRALAAVSAPRAASTLSISWAILCAGELEEEEAFSGSRVEPQFDVEYSLYRMKGTFQGN